MQAIVIGATGLIGSHLVEQLAQSQHVAQVKAINRRQIDYEHAKIENIIVDYANLSDYAEAFNGDCLFSCLGTTLKQAGSIAAQRKVDVDYQYTAAQLAKEQGVQNYFLVSSSGANANSSNAYLQMKGELEEKVMALDFASTNIFQPSLLLGERDHLRVGEKLASLVMPVLGLIPVVRKYRPIAGEQVARKMLQVSESEPTGLNYYRLAELFS